MEDGDVGIKLSASNSMELEQGRCVLDMECERTMTAKMSVASTESIMKEMWSHIFSKHPNQEDDFAAMVTTNADPRSRFVFSFWMAVSGPIIAVLVLTTFLSCCVSWATTRKATELSISLCNQSVEKQQLEIEYLLDTSTTYIYEGVLAEIEAQINKFVVELADRAVDGLWNTMCSYHAFGLDANGSSSDSRWRLAFPMLSEISGGNQNRREIINRVDMLSVIFKNGAFTGVGKGDDGNFVWYEAAPSSDASGMLQVWHIKYGADGVPNRVSVENMTHHPITELPSYVGQGKLALENPTGPPVQMWSGVYFFADAKAKVSWTSPLMYCGDYSCFDGVLVASFTVRTLNTWCYDAWQKLTAKVREHPFDYSNHLGDKNSIIFVVNQISPSNPFQEGWLLGSTDMSGTVQLGPAVNSELHMVKATSRVLLERFTTWNAAELQDQVTPFTFRINTSGFAVVEDCDKLETLDAGCYHVATRSVSIDFRTKWLLVVALPADAWTEGAREMMAKANEEIKEAEKSLEEFGTNHLLLTIGTSVVLGVFVIIVGILLGKLVSHDLSQLSKFVSQLGQLDFSTESKIWGQLMMGKRSRIVDVKKLQTAFVRFACSIQIFARFVPERVVQDIVNCNEKALRLHVARREVTIMFSDVRDFTSIAESLSQRDLLVVLTKYLNLITTIVESFGGVVTEILGDGVLAFWNTPDDIEHHATKGCQAALAQQEALESLNRDLSLMGLPQLAIRIGLHTGVVLSGNLGSQKKMKFGCMGDPVNLASRLEGLCKFYGVGVICSGTTQDAVLSTAGVVFRKLDYVRVKGRSSATRIYEVVGFASPENSAEASCGETSLVTPCQLEKIRIYEDALSCWQQAEFEEARQKTSVLLSDWPEDVAALNLDDRVSSYLSRRQTMTEEELTSWTGDWILHEK